jgi:hypothetical protein
VAWDRNPTGTTTIVYVFSCRNQCEFGQWAPASPPRGADIDKIYSNNHRQDNRGCYRSHRQQPPGAPPSTSSTSSVVAAVRPASSNPQGAVINIFFNFGGGHCQTRREKAPGGPQSTSSTSSMVPAAAPTGSSPKGPAIVVFFSFGGGHYHTHQQ